MLFPKHLILELRQDTEKQIVSLQNIEVTTEKDSNLMSTLLVSTVYPEEGRKSTFVEVATIRSPYSFTFEDGISTRNEMKPYNAFNLVVWRMQRFSSTFRTFYDEFMIYSVENIKLIADFAGSSP